MNQTINNATTLELWDSSIHKIGGKHIKSLSISVTENNNFADCQNLTTTFFDDVILLKRSNEITFCNFKLSGRNIIWSTNLDNIDRLYCFSGNSKESAIALHTKNDGLFWLFHIKN